MKQNTIATKVIKWACENIITDIFTQSQQEFINTCCIYKANNITKKNIMKEVKNYLHLSFNKDDLFDEYYPNQEEEVNEIITTLFLKENKNNIQYMLIKKLQPILNGKLFYIFHKWEGEAIAIPFNTNMEDNWKGEGIVCFTSACKKDKFYTFEIGSFHIDIMKTIQSGIYKKHACFEVQDFLKKYKEYTKWKETSSKKFQLNEQKEKLEKEHKQEILQLKEEFYDKIINKLA